MTCGWCGRPKGDECSGCRVVGEGAPSGEFCRASRVKPDGSIVVGPSAPTPEAAVRELDRDSGGPQVRARRPIPGEPTFTPRRALVDIARRGWPLALLLVGTQGCATLTSFADKAERARQEVEGTIAALDAVLDECEEIQEPRPALCEQADRLAAELRGWGR